MSLNALHDELLQGADRVPHWKDQASVHFADLFQGADLVPQQHIPLNHLEAHDQKYLNMKKMKILTQRCWLYSSQFKGSQSLL